MASVRTILAAFGGRPAAAVLLVYQAVFLNVFLPGHTRGAITVDGKHAAACCCCGGAVQRPAGGHGPAAPSPDDRAHCALCEFAAGLTPDVSFRVTPDELGLLDLLPLPPPAVVCSRDLTPTYLACGPPPSPARG